MNWLPTDSSASVGFNLVLCTVLRTIILFNGIIRTLSMKCLEIVLSLNHEGIACFAEFFFLLEVPVESIQEMISLIACHSRLFLYPMNVMRCYWVLIHSTHSISLCLLDADIEPEDQEIEHYYTQHHDHDRNGKIAHHPLEGLYQNTSIFKSIFRLLNFVYHWQWNNRSCL